LPAQLDGLRLAHITDLHINRRRARHQQLVDELAEQEIDLVLMSGDYMSWPGDERHALPEMARITRQLRPAYGTFGIFGNHDTLALRGQMQQLPVRWLHNQVHHLDQLNIELLGLGMLASEYGDSVAMMLEGARQFNTSDGAPGSGDRSLRIMLAHRPEVLMTAADLDVDLMLAGHTHGGQCRLPGKRALLNSSTFPLPLTSGAFRHRRTLGVIARGVGEITLPFRVCCPAHVPVYTLRKRDWPTTGDPRDAIQTLWTW